MQRIDSILSSDAHWNVNKKLAREIGLVPTILLMELIFCRKKYGEDEFWIQAERLCELVNIGDSQRRDGTKILVDKGFISVVKKGQPARFFYTIHDEKLSEFLFQSSENLSTRPQEILAHNKKIDNKKIEESKSHCVGFASTEITPTKTDSHFIAIEDLIRLEQNKANETYTIKYPIHRKRQKQLMARFTLEQICHLISSFCILRQKEQFWKKHPILITSLSDNLIERILTTYPFPAKEKTQMDKLIEIEQQLKARTK